MTAVVRKPFIVVVSGPSGVGKSTVVGGVLERVEGFSRSVSLATRSPRKGEVDGEDYHFVDSEEFGRRREAGELLEWAEVHGNLYGTPLDFVEGKLAGGSCVMLEIDVQGGMDVKGKRPDAVLIFLLPPDFGELERRLRGRGTDDDDVISRRLENARMEMSFYDKYDYVVVNDDIGRCVGDILGIIRSESLRLDRTSVDITY